MKWSEKSKVDEGIVENGDCVGSIIIETTIINEECIFVAKIKVACYSKETPCEVVFNDECVTTYQPLCEPFLTSIKYEDEIFSSEGRLQMLQEKNLVDILLNGAIIEQDETKYKDCNGILEKEAKDEEMEEALNIKEN